MSARLGLVAVGLLLIAAVGLAGEPQAGVAPENTVDAVMGRLAATKMNVDVDKQAPDKVLDLIRDAAKVNIVVDANVRKLWETETLTLKLKDVSALSVLHHVLRQSDSVATYAEEALLVTSPQTAQPQPQITVYDIHDITQGLRDFRLPPTVFGNQIDPLFYYYTRSQLGPLAGSTAYAEASYDPFYDLELLNRYPPDSIGQVVADTIERQLGGKELGISATYRDGYLIVVQQPKAPRVPLTQAEIDKAIRGTTGK